MTIGAIAELKSIDPKTNSLFKALQNPTLHRIASLMMVERFKAQGVKTNETNKTR